MKKLLLMGIVFILFLSSCYQLPKQDMNKSFVLSPDPEVDGRFGRAVAMVEFDASNVFAFVGEGLQDGFDVADPSKPVIEGGHVKLYKLDVKTGLWKNVVGANGKPIKYCSADCAVGDEFGASIYYQESADKSKRMIFITSLMAASTSSDRKNDQNCGAVYVFSIPANFSTSLTLTQLAKIEPNACADVSYDKASLQDYYPDASKGKKYEIQLSKVAPGLGFGKWIKFDINSEVLIVSAPYESYYKDLQDDGKYIYIRRPGAVYVFEPAVAGVYTGANSWVMKERLRPQWYLPQYDNVKYYTRGGAYIGETVVERKTSLLLDEDRQDVYFGTSFDVYDDTIVVGHSGASFLYYRTTSPDSPTLIKVKDYYSRYGSYPSGKNASNGEEQVPVYFNAAGGKIDAPTAVIYKCTEYRDGVGAAYVYKRDSSGKWGFKQRLDRSHPWEGLETIRVGSYVVGDNDNFFQKAFHLGDGMGESVLIYKDAIYLGMPYYDWSLKPGKEGCFRSKAGASGIAFYWNDQGALARFNRGDSKEYQFPVEIITDSKNKLGDSDSPQWGRRLIRRENTVAMGVLGNDYFIFQNDIGQVEMYQLSSDGKSLSPTDSTSYSTEELFKGGQKLGNYMDFSDNYLICGVPDFSLTIYYNNPYVQWYSLDRCGALYFFKRTK